MPADFYQKLEEVLKKDPRYKIDAYEFMMQALGHTQKKLNRQGHVSGRELLAGVKELGLELYGPMALNVFHHWGVESTDDCGEIVFNMVNCGLMGSTEKDSKEDFKNVYDLKEVFDSKEQFKLER